MLQKSLWTIVCLVLTKVLIAQGPPILLDKPIMLGANKGTLRSYIKINDMKPFDFNTLMVEADYNPSVSPAHRPPPKTNAAAEKGKVLSRKNENNCTIQE